MLAVEVGVERGVVVSVPESNFCFIMEGLLEKRDKSPNYFIERRLRGNIFIENIYGNLPLSCDESDENFGGCFKLVHRLPIPRLNVELSCNQQNICECQKIIIRAFD